MNNIQRKNNFFQTLYELLALLFGDDAAPKKITSVKLDLPDNTEMLRMKNAIAAFESKKRGGGEK